MLASESAEIVSKRERRRATTLLDVPEIRLGRVAPALDSKPADDIGARESHAFAPSAEGVQHGAHLTSVVSRCQAERLTATDSLDDCDGGTDTLGPVIDQQEILRAYLEAAVADLAGGVEAQFCARTTIPHPNLSEVLNRKTTRKATFGWLEKIVRAYGIPWSRVYSDLALLAARIEQARADSLSASPSVAPSPRKH